VALGSGDLIGLARDGTDALPNEIGISASSVNIGAPSLCSSDLADDPLRRRMILRVQMTTRPAGSAGASCPAPPSFDDVSDRGRRNLVLLELVDEVLGHASDVEFGPYVGGDEPDRLLQLEAIEDRSPLAVQGAKPDSVLCSAFGQKSQVFDERLDLIEYLDESVNGIEISRTRVSARAGRGKSVGTAGRLASGCSRSSARFCRERDPGCSESARRPSAVG
jgi:hypothetical protein